MRKKANDIVTEQDFSAKNVIINVPEKRNRLVYRLEQIIAYVLTILVWWGMLHYLYQNLFHIETIKKTADMMFFLFFVMLLIFLIEAGWQFYNLRRYGGKDRRKEFSPQSLEEVGKLYGISAENMKTLSQVQKVAVIRWKNNKYYYTIEGKEPIEVVTLREKSSEQ